MILRSVAAGSWFAELACKEQSRSQCAAALISLANECGDDLKAYGSCIKLGEGRMLQCTGMHNVKVSMRCEQVLEDTGLKN